MKRLLIAVLLLTGCESIKSLVQKPKLTVQGGRVAGLSLDQVDLIVDLGIDNPNSFGLSVAGIDFALALDGRPFLDGKTTSGLTIKAASKSSVPVTVGVPVPKIAKTLAHLATANEIPYKIEGGITLFASALGEFRLPFTHEGKLPIPHLPTLSLGDLHIDDLKLRSAKIRLDLVVKNPNAFALTKLGGGLRLTLDDKEIGELDANIGGTIDPGKEGTGSVAAEIKTMSLLPKLAGKEISVKLAGGLGADTPFGRLKLPVSMEKRVAIRK